MVSYKEIQASNAPIKDATAPRVAVFVGGTSGIGKLPVSALVATGVSVRIFLVGRKSSKERTVLSSRSCTPSTPSKKSFGPKVRSYSLRKRRGYPRPSKVKSLASIYYSLPQAMRHSVHERRLPRAYKSLRALGTAYEYSYSTSAAPLRQSGSP